MDELVNKEFNRLTVVKVLPKYRKNSKGRYETFFECKCSCGKENIIVRATSVKSGHTKSCGCLQKERASQTIANNTTHGKSDLKAYKIWRSMRSRCNLVTDKSYKYYGERGISVCDEWNNSFESFYNWLIQNGYIETDSRNISTTLDRINVNGNYEPTNCRLVSMYKQANNTRKNRFITYNDETHTVAEWAKIKGMKYKSFCNRLYRGWSIDRIMET